MRNKWLFQSHKEPWLSVALLTKRNVLAAGLLKRVEAQQSPVGFECKRGCKKGRICVDFFSYLAIWATTALSELRLLKTSMYHAHICNSPAVLLTWHKPTADSQINQAEGGRIFSSLPCMSCFWPLDKIFVFMHPYRY